MLIKSFANNLFSNIFKNLLFITYDPYLIWLVIYKLLWIFHIEPYPREVATVDSFFNFHGYTVKTQVVIFLSLFEITGKTNLQTYARKKNFLLCRFLLSENQATGDLFKKKL